VSKNLSRVTKEEQIKNLINQTVKKETPKTAKQLIALMEERYFISPTKTIDLIIELENENHLHFTRQELAKPSSLSEYVFSRNAIWYWITIMIVVVTTIAVFTITGNGEISWIESLFAMF